MVRAIPVNKATPAKAGATSPKRGRGRPPKDITAADGSVVASVDAANSSPFVFPPPPPPPPPPVDNPYYQKFVEQYWQKYDGSYTTLPPMPSIGAPVEPAVALATAKATPSKTSRETLMEIPRNLPPIPLSQEFPINTDRPTYFIGNPIEDAEILSDKSCYIRSRLFELFLTLPSDNVHWKVKGTKSAENVVGRVGLRCVYCAKSPQKSRAERNATYPSSISRLYNTVADMQHKHLEVCESIPPQVRQVIHRLSNSASNRSMAPKTYWEASAKQFGMEDIEEGEKAGIRVIDEGKLIRKSLSTVERMFVPMGEDLKSTGVGVKRREVTSDGAASSQEGEKKVEKADEEVEEILAHL